MCIKSRDEREGREGGVNYDRILISGVNYSFKEKCDILKSELKSFYFIFLFVMVNS